MECVVIQNRIFSDSCWERASHSALRVNCRKNVLLCFMYFLTHPASYVGTLNLMASIPGPTILTFQIIYFVLRVNDETLFRLPI